MFPDVKQLFFDLPEIQSLDSKKIIEFKLSYASAKLPDKKIFVEDTSLHLDCLNGFPGPLIKWLLHSLKCEGIFDLCQKYNNAKAWAVTTLGFTNANENDFHYFEGKIEGEIVSPKGKDGFGWDPIFQPQGLTRTFSEMSFEEKNRISMRTLALKKLKNFLDESC
ncbi:MAG: hypothetical protein A3B70_01515 [Deltaproteobacteria bacterium RIFCSPHIGHO2_02_FULL_40_11]|nr:MAG: hypothetical protein A3B70_01515 [Deltaproteobacteria bacterium RIFCSPHIGHO2_02_FULL_40_11]